MAILYIVVVWASAQLHNLHDVCFRILVELCTSMHKPTIQVETEHNFTKIDPITT